MVLTPKSVFWIAVEGGLHCLATVLGTTFNILLSHAGNLPMTWQSIWLGVYETLEWLLEQGLVVGVRQAHLSFIYWGFHTGSIISAENLQWNPFSSMYKVSLRMLKILLQDNAALEFPFKIFFATRWQSGRCPTAVSVDVAGWRSAAESSRYQQMHPGLLELSGPLRFGTLPQMNAE